MQRVWVAAGHLTQECGGQGFGCSGLHRSPLQMLAAKATMQRTNEAYETEPQETPAQGQGLLQAALQLP